MVLLLSPLAFIAYLWKRVPSKECDAMMIAEEFKITCYVIALSFVGYLIAVVVMALGNQLTASIVATTSTIWIVATPSLVATVWIPFRLSSKLTAVLTANPSMELAKGIFKNRTMNAEGARVSTIQGELAILYKDELKMEAFGGWMMKRFAVQSFLCFVEMVQFKERVIALIEQQNMEFDEHSVLHRHQLYKHCPRSSIVFNQNEKHQTDDADHNADVFVELETDVSMVVVSSGETKKDVLEEVGSVGTELELTDDADHNKKKEIMVVVSSGETKKDVV